MDENDDIINDETYDVITFTDNDGKKTDFYVIDCLEYKKMNYLLVVECESYNADDDEAEAFIMKETASDENSCIYEFVDDDDEYNRIAVLLQKEDSDYEMKFDE